MKMTKLSGFVLVAIFILTTTAFADVSGAVLGSGNFAQAYSGGWSLYGGYFFRPVEAYIGMYLNLKVITLTGIRSFPGYYTLTYMASDGTIIDMNVAGLFSGSPTILKATTTKNTYDRANRLLDSCIKVYDPAGMPVSEDRITRAYSGLILTREITTTKSYSNGILSSSITKSNTYNSAGKLIENAYDYLYYDNNSQLTLEYSGVTAYAYYPTGQLLSKAFTSKIYRPGQNNFSVSKYVYDTAGRITSYDSIYTRNNKLVSRDKTVTRYDAKGKVAYDYVETERWNSLNADGSRELKEINIREDDFENKTRRETYERHDYLYGKRIFSGTKTINYTFNAAGQPIMMVLDQTLKNDSMYQKIHKATVYTYNTAGRILSLTREEKTSGMDKLYLEYSLTADYSYDTAGGCSVLIKDKLTEYNLGGNIERVSYANTKYTNDSTGRILLYDMNLSYYDANGKMISRYVESDKWTRAASGNITAAESYVAEYNRYNKVQSEKLNKYWYTQGVADSCSINYVYNPSGILTSKKGTMQIKGADYRIDYTVDASGKSTYTHVYGANGKEIQSFSKPGDTGIVELYNKIYGLTSVGADMKVKEPAVLGDPDVLQRKAVEADIIARSSNPLFSPEMKMISDTAVMQQQLKN